MTAVVPEAAAMQDCLAVWVVDSESTPLVCDLRPAHLGMHHDTDAGLWWETDDEHKRGGPYADLIGEPVEPARLQ